MEKSLFINEEELIDFQNLLREHKKTITTAESCTGGLIASMITRISGSSDIFRGAVVTYCNEIKTQELCVQKNTLDTYGAVSIQVVDEMLKGVIKKFDADFAIAVSGVAGPNGGTENKPVGTVVIGVMGKNIEKNIEICHFKGTRNEVQNLSAKYSLKKLFNFFKKTLDK